VAATSVPQVTVQTFCQCHIVSHLSVLPGICASFFLPSSHTLAPLQHLTPKHETHSRVRNPGLASPGAYENIMAQADTVALCTGGSRPDSAPARTATAPPAMTALADAKPSAGGGVAADADVAGEQHGLLPLICQPACVHTTPRT
jgi:hypothetical protein